MHSNDDDDDSWDAFLALKQPHVECCVGSNDTDLLALKQLHSPLDRHYQVFEVAMDKWLPYVEPFTFSTQTVAFGRNLAFALLADMKRFSIIGGKEVPRALSEALTAEQVDALAVLEKQIDNLCPGFVKLSTRSPKDSVFDMQNPKTQSLLDGELSKLGSPPHSDNDIVNAFFKSANRAMCVDSGKEALILLRQSARIRQDIERALKDDHWVLHIVVREWINLKLESEFRGFVNDGRLTAISQYFWFSQFPQLVEKHDAILDSLTSFFETHIRDAIPFDSYVIDFAIDDEKIYIVELNPFGTVSGACLYDWNRDHDLLHGILSAKTTLRVRVEPMENARQRALVPLWDRYITEQLSSETAANQKCGRRRRRRNVLI